MLVLLSDVTYVNRCHSGNQKPCGVLQVLSVDRVLGPGSEFRGPHDTALGASDGAGVLVGGQGWGPQSWLGGCPRGPSSSRLTPAPPHSGLNGVPGSIWDFVSGSFSPSPSPILNAGPAASSGVSPSSAELARVRRQLDEAKRKIRQWEESWQQVKQVSCGGPRCGRAGQGAGPTGRGAGLSRAWGGEPAPQGHLGSWVSGLRRMAAGGQGG